MAVLTLEGVELAYPSSAGRVRALAGVDLEVRAGESVAVVGRSGSGKSSLLAVAAGLEPATAGEARLFGTSLAGLSEDGRARLRRGRAALVFQSFHLLPNLTAEENVAAGLEIARRAAARRTAREWLERVGLADRRRHYPRQLSGGEQQRVAIARALAIAPELVFADEPTGNLDEESAAAAADLLFGLAGESRAALVLVTHDPGLAARADRRYRMSGGRLEPA